MSTEQTLDHVVITGSSGWLGSELIRGLTEGLSQSKYYSNPSPNLQITAMDLPGKESFKHSNVQPSFGDICNPEDCKKAVANKPGLTLFHLAGVIHPKKVAEFYKTNRDGTKNILEAAATQKPRRIVVVSSNSPFGCNPHNDHVFDEWSSYNPYMGYGQSKMQMEYAVKEFRRTTGINAILIRAPWFYGPNPPDRQREFFSMIRKGRFPILGKGENRRSMVYLENLIQGLIHASLADVHQQDYWVADERPYPMMEIIKTVGYALEQEFGIKVKKNRLRLPWITGQIAQVIDYCLQKLGIYHQKIHVLSEMNKNIACSIDKARRELDYNPQYSIETGIKEAIRWHLNKGQSI